MPKANRVIITPPISTPQASQIAAARAAIYAHWIRYVSHVEALEQCERFARQFESRR